MYSRPNLFSSISEPPDTTNKHTDGSQGSEPEVNYWTFDVSLIIIIGIRGTATARTEGMLEEAEAGSHLLPPLLLGEGFDSATVEMLQGRGAIHLRGAGAKGFSD
jgi:hypothetical protein